MSETEIKKTIKAVVNSLQNVRLTMEQKEKEIREYFDKIKSNET